MIRIDAALLVRAIGCTPGRAAQFADHLDGACTRYSINATAARLAAFLAQLALESGALRYVQEIASGAAYEGRRDLGNTEPGDGVRFKGRGLIQTTGRANYVALRNRLRASMGPDVPDFEAEPEQLEAGKWAAWSAADYWAMRRLNDLADDDTEAATVRISRAVNRGNAYSSKPANHEAERVRYWRQARAVLAQAEHAPAPIVDRSLRAEPQPPAAPDQETAMPLPAFVAAALPALISSIPTLGKLFGSGSDVAERNVRAAQLAVGIIQEATGSRNAQEAAETVASDPAMAKAATEAVQARWHDLIEAGGGGIEGARKADAETAKGRDMLHSPSFWVALPLLGIVIMIVGAVVGLWGSPFSEDVRSAIANGIPMLILGGLIGYYYGQTTSRNRS
jgi:putative chitinase